MAIFGIESSCKQTIVMIKLIIDFTVVQIQDKFQIEFRHSSFYSVQELNRSWEAVFQNLFLGVQKLILARWFLRCATITMRGFR